MKNRARRIRTTPRLELIENRTLLSGVGVNMGVNYQFQGDPVWTNVARLMGAWNYVDETKWRTPNPDVETNALGSPLSDASAYAILQYYPDGVYNVSFKGTVNVDFAGVGRLVSPLVKGADGVTRGQLSVDASYYSDAQRPLIMNVTAVDVDDPLADLKIIAPGYPADGSRIYTSEFLRDLQPFDNIRFMDWELTNGSKIRTWSERGRSEQITSASLTGRPIDYESMIELGNQTGNDIWLNVPALADDDYIKNLADLVRDRLDSDLKVYIEYSNETWNYYFGQYGQVLDAAKSNPLITSSDAMTMVAQQSAFMTKKISDIFRQEFGAEFDRVVPVFGSWAAVPNWTTLGLRFVEDHYGAPSQYIKSVAVAPYFGLKKGTDTKWQSVSGLFHSISQDLKTTATEIEKSVDAAAAFGIPLDAYEGGQNLGSYSKAKAAAQDDPRMYDVYKQYLEIWRNAGGGLIDFYTYSGDSWGLKPRVTYPGSQKWDSVISTITPLGDASLDGKVDFADFQILAANYGGTGRWWEQGDFNRDGKVDEADLDVLRDNLDVGALSAAQAATLATFGRALDLTSSQSLEFNLFSRDYLSDLAYSVAQGSAVADGSYSGDAGGSGAATLGGSAYAKGLGVSSKSKLSVPLKGAYTTFYATIGVDDRAGSGVGRTVFQVLGDGQVLYTSPVMSGGVAPIVVEIPVTGVSTLQLVTSVDGDASASTPAVWAMARVLNTAPTSTATQTSLAWTVKKDGQLVSSSDDASFVFAPTEPGTYVVSVQATDPGGGKSSRSVSIDVAPGASSNTATFLEVDSKTKGSWKGAFGTAGYSLAGSESSLPDYSWMRVSGASMISWSLNTTDVRALEQAPSNATKRIARAWSGESFSIDVGFADGLTHVVSLYAVDWDRRSRSERIDVVDAATGEVLDSRSISSFQNGVYLSWNVRGQVRFVVTRLGGAASVVSGLFIDGITTGSFVAEDDATRGDWEGVYGSQGYLVANSRTELPSYVSAAEWTGATVNTWAWSGTNQAAPQVGDLATNTRSFATWSGAEYSLNVAFTDNSLHKLTLYFFDPVGSGRVQQVDLIDPSTGAVLDSRTLTDFQNGTYLSWDVSGRVQVRITRVAPFYTAFCSGVFFDDASSSMTIPKSGDDPTTDPGTEPGGDPGTEPGGDPAADSEAEASFASTDSTTKGNWKGKYGSDGHWIPAVSSSYPSYARVVVSDARHRIWTGATTDSRGLQKASGNSTLRSATAWIGDSFTINVDFTDDETHQISLYLLDWDRKGRSERIDVVDAETGAVLDSRTVSSFTGGEYLTWNVKGSVKFVVTGLAGHDAVVSGIFFD